MRTLKTNNTYRFVLSFLIFSTIIYSLVLYRTPTENHQELNSKAIYGQDLWQQNNCAACHQIYGLGGYLGPDLTNIYSDPKKGPNYIKAFLNSGVKMMPQFHFTEEEKDAIVAFLEQVDQTGIYPNLNAKIENTGWVTEETKK